MKNVLQTLSHSCLISSTTSSSLFSPLRFPLSDAAKLPDLKKGVVEVDVEESSRFREDRREKEAVENDVWSRLKLLYWVGGGGRLPVGEVGDDGEVGRKGLSVLKQKGEMRAERLLL